MPALITAAVARFTYFGKDDSPTDPFFYILTFYLLPFMILFLAAEMQWQGLLKYFQFLGHLYGKAFFLIFIALLLFDTKYPIDTAVSIYMTLVGLFNLLVSCIVPSGSLLYNYSSLRYSGKDKREDNGDESGSGEDNSENDCNEHDELLPKTYGSVGRGGSDSGPQLRHNNNNHSKSNTSNVA